MSSCNEYMDLDIAEIDDKGCMGAFVMSREDTTTFCITFVFDGNTRQLTTHSDGGEVAVISEFRTVFFTDVEEYWLKWVKDRAAKRAQARKFVAACTQQWAVN